MFVFLSTCNNEFGVGGDALEGSLRDTSVDRRVLRRQAVQEQSRPGGAQPDGQLAVPGRLFRLLVRLLGVAAGCRNVLVAVLGDGFAVFEPVYRGRRTATGLAGQADGLVQVRFHMRGWLDFVKVQLVTECIGI